MAILELIKKIEDHANLYASSLQSDALDVVRNPEDTSKMEKAKRTLLIHETRIKIAEDIIRMIKLYGPKETPPPAVDDDGE